MTGQHWIPHLAKNSRSGVCRGEGGVAAPGTVGQVFGKMPSLALCMAHRCTHAPQHYLVGMETSQII